MVTEKALAIKENLIELSVKDIVDLRTIQMNVIKEIMKRNIHFGKIPGTPKPSLWQPGAQVLDTLHGYAPTFELLDKTEDWDNGFFAFRYKCRLIRKRDDATVGEGVGSCNSREKKYRIAVYHGEDEGKPVDPRDNVNTYEKMAQKRAHISATLNATGLSDIFTVDVEDMIDQFIPGEYKVVDTTDEDSTATSKEHWCKVHKTAFFKKGKMKWFAHPIGDTGKWCSENKKTETKEADLPDASQITTDMEFKKVVAGFMSQLGWKNPELIKHLEQNFTANKLSELSEKQREVLLNQLADLVAVLHSEEPEDLVY